MRTSKPISTISYNTIPFLDTKLAELVRNHKISDYMYIFHHAEKDEKKDHIHLWLKPNTLLDTMDIQHFLTEPTDNPSKPLKCIDFRITHDTDDWILYSQHFRPYLATKGESRDYLYTRDDFRFCDEDTFDDLYMHAFKGSKWAQNNQILQQLTNGDVSPVDLIKNGTIPLGMACQLSAFNYMNTHTNGVDRGGRQDHEQKEYDCLSLHDDSVAEALFRYANSNYQAFISESNGDLTLAEWVYNFRLKEFNDFCRSKYDFEIKEYVPEQ